MNPIKNLIPNLPTRWAICPCCDGEGQSSAHLGSFTQSDIDQDPDFFADYKAGAYDRACDECNGSGKVKEVAIECLTEEQREQYDDACDYAREVAIENRMRERGIQF